MRTETEMLDLILQTAKTLQVKLSPCLVHELIQQHQKMSFKTMTWSMSWTIR